MAREKKKHPAPRQCFVCTRILRSDGFCTTCKKHSMTKDGAETFMAQGLDDVRGEAVDVNIYADKGIGSMRGVDPDELVGKVVYHQLSDLEQAALRHYQAAEAVEKAATLKRQAKTQDEQPLPASEAQLDNALGWACLITILCSTVAIIWIAWLSAKGLGWL